MPGAWVEFDYVSWHCSALFGLMFLVVLTGEIALRYQRTILWNSALVSLAMNLIKIILVFVYLDVGWVRGNWKSAGVVYQVYAVVQAFVYACSDFAMYQRKKRIAPTERIDEIVLVLCILFGTAQCIPVLIGNVAWEISANFLVVEQLLSCGYFDLYYVYKFTQTCRKVDQTMDWSRMGQVLVPVLWTLLNTVCYCFGTQYYAAGKGDFYSNALWNFTSVIGPICTVQSNVSSSIATVYKSVKVSYKESGDASQVLSAGRKSSMQ
jgi:hypothetical protein